MTKVLLTALCSLLCCSALRAEAFKIVDLHDLAVKVTDKGFEGMNLGHYVGASLYHGMADLAIASGDPSDMERLMAVMRGFVSGEITATFFNSYSYYTGGQAMPFLAWKAGKKELEQMSLEYARKMWEDQARTSEGLMTGNNQKKRPEMDGIWIDLAFTFTPYMLFSGLLADNQEWIDFAAWEILKLYEILYDKDTDGLFHQARAIGGLGRGEVSEDCWSRGNGWGSMAFASCLLYYPKSGKYYKVLRSSAKKFYLKVAEYMDSEGLWHQEMTNFDSFVEFSGSAQLLAGLGAAIESGVLSRNKYLPVFEKGLKALLGYIDQDGSIGHCCSANLVPGTKGLKSEYAKAHFYYNEAHAFGPALLALAQALRLGYNTIELDEPLGHFNDKDRPRAYCKLVTERKEDFAWENDQIAFRVYSRAFVPKHNLSGVDLWPKSVDYSIIDKRYREHISGQSYHEDRGEGCDFFDMGSSRGIGGTAYWHDGRPVLPELYSNYRIYKNDPERIDFRLDFVPAKVGDDIIYSSKRIEMICGTPFYKVTETLESESGADIILAVGISNFGSAIVETDMKRGVLSAKQTFSHQDGIRGRGVVPTLTSSEVYSGVVADPLQVQGFASTDTDEYVLIRVKSGQSVIYFAGALWSEQYYTGHARLKHEPYWTEILNGDAYSKLTGKYETSSTY